MPKEITYSDHGEYVLTDDGSEVDPKGASGPVLRRGLSIGWSREHGHVEVGMNAFNVSTQHGSHDTGMYASFDRAGLNRIIRSLRKARDQAFGADA